ncbi:AhpC/TSA family protein [Bacteroides sp. BFG-638]|uniref:TlpA disulfide reductase family protein n=1 Tax=Bacteroides TaxID=816 RepID=UPI001F1CAFCB|nr:MULTISPECIES: TlpA disulfide reductase family protein [Bacteroides]MCE8924711.1 AhpC/TSA family protein [Bacteroides ovatus]MCS2947700.1 AhpC/TSA family protein [Bacteroides sp. BFG-638]MCS3311323.1 AhpC/TSA family protein [Bacteroides sp. BFG-637]
MKRFYGLCILLPAVSMTVAQVPYQIKGTWNNGAGKTVYLQKYITADSLQTVDSVKVAQDFSFSLKGQVKEEQRMAISCSPRNKAEIFVNTTPLQVTIQEKTVTDKKGRTRNTCQIAVKGDREQEVLKSGETLSTTASFFQLGKMITLSRALDSKDTTAIDSAKYKVAMIDSLITRSVQNYMDSTRNDITSTYFFERYLMTNQTLDEVQAFYDNLTDRVKKSAPGVALKQKMEDMQQVNIGGMAPNFELTTPDGKKLSLYDLRGHIVLLDFWASWCGPCLAEVPNLKAIYEKYHGKGLEILGVSLDEKEAAWKGAIERKGLTWQHVSSLKGWKCPVAQRFKVTGIPRMYIIDAQGKIIAQDLRGEKLAEKMDELFTK